jgi:hypothetical protein
VIEQRRDFTAAAVETALCYALGMALPPTTTALLEDGTRPYFLWWTDCTVGAFRRHLQDPSRSTRAYWLGALLREGNTRDVWLFTSREQIAALWPELRRHLGRSRARWAWLLDLPDAPLPMPAAD